MVAASFPFSSPSFCLMDPPFLLLLPPPLGLPMGGRCVSAKNIIFSPSSSTKVHNWLLRMTFTPVRSSLHKNKMSRFAEKSEEFFYFQWCIAGAYFTRLDTHSCSLYTPVVSTMVMRVHKSGLF